MDDSAPHLRTRFRLFQDSREDGQQAAGLVRCGGLTVWLRVAALAQAAGLEISGHCAPHLHAQAAASVSNLRHPEWFHGPVRIESRFFDGILDPAGGTVRPGADGAPGHGLSLRGAEAEPYRVG